MIRALRAVVWMRWRTLRNTLRVKSRRDSLELLSRLMTVVAPVAVYIIFLAMAISLGGLAFTGARLSAGGLLNPIHLLLPVRIVLIAVIVPLILVPTGRSLQGGGAATTRMMLLPIPRGVLHLVEVVAGLFDPWMAFVPLSLLLIPAGFAAAGRVDAALVALAAGAGILACIGCLGTLGSALVQWLLRDRRRGELVVLAVMLVVIFIGFVPAMMIQGDQEWRDRERSRREARRNTPMPTLEQFDARLPAASLALPSELYGRAVRRALEGRPGPGLLCAAALAAEAALLFAISSRAHRRLLMTPAVQGRRGRKGKAGRLPLTLPGFRGAVPAVAVAQVWTFLRTVRGKLALLMAGPMVILMASMLGRIPADEVPFLAALASKGDLMVFVALAMAILSLQPLVLNQFASDRAGLTLQFLSPLSNVQLVASRALAGGLLLLVCVLPGLVVAWVMFRDVSIWLWLAALASGCSTFFLLTPLSILLSMTFPRASDLSSVGSAGNAHPLAGLMGVLSMLVSLLVSWLVTWLGSGLAGSPALAFLLAAGWAAVAAGLGMLCVPLLSEALARRRENLALVAQGR